MDKLNKLNVIVALNVTDVIIPDVFVIVASISK